MLHRQMNEKKRSNNLKLKRKLVKKVFAMRQLNGEKVNVFRMATKLNPSAEVEYRSVSVIIPVQTHKKKKQFDRQIKADNGKCFNYFVTACILQSTLL